MTTDERLEKLERELEGMAKCVRAERFELVDERGAVRAGLFMDKDGPVLDLLDENGTPRAFLATGGLGLDSETNEPRARLTADKDGVSLMLADASMRSTACLSVHQDGMASLSFSDETGEPRAQLGLLSAAGPILSLHGANGTPSVVLGATALILRDEQGRERAILIVGKDGPKLVLVDGKGVAREELSTKAWFLRDEQGTVRAFLMLGKGGPMLGLVDEKGRPVWAVPRPEA